MEQVNIQETKRNSVSRTGSQRRTSSPTVGGVTFSLTTYGVDRRCSVATIIIEQRHKMQKRLPKIIRSVIIRIVHLSYTTRTDGLIR